MPFRTEIYLCCPVGSKTTTRLRKLRPGQLSVFQCFLPQHKSPPSSVNCCCRHLFGQLLLFRDVAHVNKNTMSFLLQLSNGYFFLRQRLRRCNLLLPRNQQFSEASRHLLIASGDIDAQEVCLAYSFAFLIKSPAVHRPLRYLRL